MVLGKIPIPIINKKMSPMINLSTLPEQGTFINPKDLITLEYNVIVVN